MARLFRQRRHDDWDEVMARVAVELQRFDESRGAIPKTGGRFRIPPPNAA